MSLDASLKQQLAQYLELLEEPVVFTLSVDESENSRKVEAFVEEIVAMSDKLSIARQTLDLTPSFSLNRADASVGVVFAGLPLGHEFASFVLALLQVSGRAPQVDAQMIQRIQALDEDIHFETFVSLTCQNCPDVVQALNILSVLNPKITHTMVEGSMFQDYVASKNVLAVPTVFANGEQFSSGRMTLEQIVNMIEPADASTFENKGRFDVLVVGGGPAAGSASIYAVRKGIKVGVVAESFGGQVAETAGIENFIGTKYIEGTQLMSRVKEHMQEYPIDLMEGYRVEKLTDQGDYKEVTLDNGAILEAKTVVIATGAKWRRIGVLGEEEFQTKGISYCTHCDGPMYKGKDIVVIGGGNSGVEAALDLSGIARHITLLEYSDHLLADQVLQDRLAEIKNIDVLYNIDTQEIMGEGTVSGLRYRNYKTDEEVETDCQGVFILVGLSATTDFLEGILDRNERGEILIDRFGATSLRGVYAAGDCTDVPYNQIVVAVGTGATAGLSAYHYLIQEGI